MGSKNSNSKNSDSKNSRSVPFRVRPAQPKDIPALMRLKRLLAQGENALHAVRAGAADWLRDGFGANAAFTAFVAEDFSGVIGMATCSGRVVTGARKQGIILQELFVEPVCRSHRRV